MSLPKRIRIISGSILLLVVVISFVYLNRSEADASSQSTDDAYVQADITLVAPQVSGKITQVLVEDNQFVQAGDLLAVIDDRDLRVAVDSAKAQVMSSRAAISSLHARLARQETDIRQARAVVDADEASLVLAQADLKRYRNLAADGSGTLQAQQQAETQLRIQQATREKDIAALQAARQQIDILNADLQKAEAALAQAQAGLAAAELNLSYAGIAAPISGIIAQRSVRVGAYVDTGKSLLAIVPLDTIYILANYRETQLANVHPGQTVRISVDALPGITLNGSVDSLGPASGISLSPIAPHNASGNFTKIVQRLPVRIRLDPDQTATGQLRVGMSVQPTIDIRSSETQQSSRLSMLGSSRTPPPGDR